MGWARPKSREPLLCNLHAQVLATQFERKRIQKGLNPMKKVWYNDNCSGALANSLLIQPPTRPRERRGGKRGFRV